MKRLIVTPPVLPPAALAELKEWLGITTAQDDAPLGAVLRAALELCEDFTGRVPLVCECEEQVEACSTWQRLGTRPVQAITALSGIAADGSVVALPSTAYEFDLAADGGGLVRVLDPGQARRVAVRFAAGIAADWASLPGTLRHGVIRLAAHQHRAREDADAGPVPPIAVAALWRPWRRLRLT
jgi:uncharacterized phiE125 gp8 family phage protein